MDLLTLRAVLGLDTSEYEKGLSGAAQKATKGFGKLLDWIIPKAIDFGKDVLESGMQVDKTFSAVQAVLGKQEGTQANMSRLMENAQKVAADSIFTLEETGDAYYYMGMAGWKTEEMLAGLPGVINLAAASGEDLGKVSDIVTDSLTAFGLGAGQAAHFADVLAATATNSNTDVARMGKTFQYLAPIAGSLGYSIEDVAISIGLIANSGIKGSMAGTALRNVFTRIATNAGATKKDLGALEIVTKELGVSFYDSADMARPWGDVLEDMRRSWKKLDPSKADKVAAAFGDVAYQGASADEIMDDFANSLDDWQTEWNGLTTKAERESFVEKYGKQFAVLGISMRDSNGDLREFNSVANEARIKLGGLTDKQKIYYSKQISSLRGISAFLELMNATEKDVNDLTGAIMEANGAAKEMAGTRLNNLWGDVEMFNSRLDLLRYAIFDDIKGPLREVVQYATGAIERITAAINEDGLLGGIKQLGVEIEAAGEKFAPMLESLGKAVAPMVESLLTEIMPSIEKAGSALVDGALKGLSAGLLGTDSVILKLFGGAGGLLESAFYTFFGGGGLFSFLRGDVTTRNANARTMANGDTKANGLTIPADIMAQIDPVQLQQAIEEAEKKVPPDGKKWEVEIAPELTVDTDTARQILNAKMTESNATNPFLQKPTWQPVKDFLSNVFSGAVAEGASTGTTKAEKSVRTFTLKSGKQVKSAYSAAVAEGAQEGGEFAYKQTTSGAKRWKPPMKNAVSEALAEGGAEGAQSVGLELNAKPTPFLETLKNQLSWDLMIAGQTGSLDMASSLTKNTIGAGSLILSTLVQSISSAGTDGGAEMKNNIITNVSRSVGSIGTWLTNAIAGAGKTGGNKMANNVKTGIKNKSSGIQTILSGAAAAAGNDGGTRMANNVNTKLFRKSGTMQSTLATSLGNAGDSAGSDIVSRIQNALSFATFVISIFGTLFGGAGGEHFAKAQNAGRILRGATVFGMSGSGEPLIGGENGPEAVIGTNSLRDMVFDAASNAVSGVSGNTTINVYQQPGEDSQALAERIERLIAQKEMRRRSAMR